jgi:biotin carboxylase
MVAKRLLYSPDDDEIDYARLRRQHDRMVEAMGLPFGITHAEYKYDKGEFYLVEVAARGGGTRISSDIVPLLSGVDVMMLLIRTALGEEIVLDHQEPDRRCAALDFWDFAPGLVREIKGLDEVRAMPGVIAAGVNLRPGENVRAAQDDSLRHGYVIAHAEDKPALERLLRDLRSKMTIVYDERLAASPA